MWSTVADVLTSGPWLSVAPRKGVNAADARAEQGLRGSEPGPTPARGPRRGDRSESVASLFEKDRCVTFADFFCNENYSLVVHGT